MPPPYLRHVFVCQNERKPDDPRGCCSARGSGEVLEAMKAALKERNLARKIRVNKAGCLDACELGVSVVVYPEGVWYGRVTVADVPEIVASHLVGGTPVARLVVARAAGEAPGTGSAAPPTSGVPSVG